MFHVSSAVRESTAGPQQQQRAGVGPINWSLKQSSGEVRHKRNPQVSDHNLELKTVVVYTVLADTSWFIFPLGGHVSLGRPFQQDRL